MRDEEIRQRIVQGTDGSVLVEAAAGTGKTTLVVERILHGVLHGAFRLARVVAITFTEKAAGELEERLRRELTRKLHQADLSPEQLQGARHASQELDEAHVGTIHSFCARLLRERPAEAGVDPEFQVLDANAAALLRDDCWRDWMEQQVAAGPQPLAEALRADVRVEQLRSLVYALADAPEILEMPGFHLPAAEGELDDLTVAVREAAQPAMRACRELMATGGNKDSRLLRRCASEVCAAEGAAAVRRAAYEAAAADLETALKSFGKRREKARVPLEAFWQACRRLGQRLAAEVFGWAGGFLERYRSRKRERSALDFQDLLLLAARLLRNNRSARRYFRRRFAAFFVDEFQDTDPLQAELIAYLCEAEGSNAGALTEARLADGRLMAVGDPKQSIYRFRRADVEVYEQFKDLFGPERVEQVFCNFRSDVPVLQWLNELFERAFQPPEEEHVYQSRHVALETGRDEVRTAGAAVVAVHPDPDLERIGWNAERARRWEAQHLARVVREAVDGRLEVQGRREDLSYGSFAFLFRALTDVDIYEEALESHGVPYRTLGGRHFYGRTQTEETICLLRAVDDPLDEPSVVAALRSSYFGLSDEDLLRYRQAGGTWNYLRTEVRDGPVGEAMALLAEWHRLRNRVPPQVLLGRIFDLTKAPQSYMLKPAGRQRAAALDQLLRRLRALSGQAATFGAIVRHLSAMKEAELAEEESGAVEPGDDFVLLLSMHKAKGLEFPVVVLPDLGRSLMARPSRPALLFDRLDGRVAVRVGKGLSTRHYPDLAEAERLNELAETTRLFYVACTRAQNLLVLPRDWHVGYGPTFHRLLEESELMAGPDEVPYGRSQDGVHYLDTRGWSKLMDVTPARRPIPEQDSAEAKAQLEQRRQWAAQHQALADAASQGLRIVLPSCLEGEFEEAPLAEEQPGRPAGRDIGSLFHEVISRLSLGQGTDAAEGALPLALNLADETGLGPAEAEEAVGLVADALANADFLSLLEGAGKIETEVPFCVPLAALPQLGLGDKGFAEGSMDLVLRGGNGTVVLDYKTDRAVRPERYWPQLGLYGMAARACGLAEGPVELVLFYVRPGRLHRRTLDEDLIAEVAGALAEAEVT
ncbi:MAG: UvrD-helicase domain-containing protein [Candidatus Brocadiia bacterium]